ncbi:VPS10 domain-containing protein [Epilithonimonas zeae]|uniref:VPS10 domain-containing protein n=1 Tax=Epilithonimonas zeae TaxID=1416779 RepID=UPI00200CD423|nr:T9SS type A sorting domain-containing protein [Epilithonimonas zeae]UQB67187.1 T9SS type A sorting domain-containing protein [Epilithonimonas zeae]
MKKILTLFLLAICSGLSTMLTAQLSFLTSPNYGQVFDVTYDPIKPDVLYANTVTNHIVKSSDNGKNWEVLYSFPINLSFGTIKELRWTADQKYLSFILTSEGTAYNQVIIIDPDNGNVIKKVDSPNGNQSGNLIMSYSITGNNYENILLHTTYMYNFGLVTDVFYSKNGGDDWQKVYTSSNNDGVHVNNVAIHPRNPDKLFIARGFSPGEKNGGLFVSENSGNSWTEKNAGQNYSAITFDPINPQKMFLGTFYLTETQTENLYRSTDGGDNWSIVPINWTALSTNSIQKIVINPKNTNDIMILEENEIVISKDGGNTWTNYVYPNNDLENKYYYGLNATYNPSNSNEVIISSNFYPFHSLDGGITLSRFKNPFANNTEKVSFHKNTEKHLYYGLRRGFIHQDFQTGEETGINLQAINFFPNFNNNGLFADPLVAGRVYISSSGFMGSTFAVSNNHGADYSTGYSDYGLNIMKIATSKLNTNHSWVAFNETVRKFDFTDMSGITSEEVMLPAFGTVFAISIDEFNENNVILSQNNNVYRTTDGGQNWTPSESGLNVLEKDVDFIYDINKNPFNKDQLLLSTTQGIFISNDAGAKWTQIYDGNVINKAEFSPYKDGVIVASSNFMNGSGEGYAYPPSQVRIVYSKDFGQNWSEISPESLGYLFSESSAIDFLEDDKADIYFSTSDLGLVKYQISLETLGTNNNSLSKVDLIIYPNPTSDYITISNDKVKEAVIVDFAGKTVLKSTLKTLDLTNLPKGVYILNVTLENGKSISKKIIKK